MVRRIIVVSIVALILGMTLAGCGNLPSGVDGAQQAVCDTLDGVFATVDQLDGIQAEATAADIKELKTKVDGTIDVVRTANKVLNAETINELLTSYDSLSLTIDGLDDDAAIGEALTEVQRSVAGVTEALAEVSSALKCGQ